MSQQDHIKKLILMSTRRLQVLERQLAVNGADTPPHLLMEIDDLKTQLATWQSELEELEQPGVIEPPPEIQDLYYSTKATLNGLRQTLDNLSRERKFISAEAQAKAMDLLEQAKQHLLALEKEWLSLEVEAAATEVNLKTLQAKIAAVKVTLHPLVLRQNYRRRFSLLEEKLASQPLALSEEQLRTTLSTQIDKLQEHIEALELKAVLTAQDQKLLAGYRRSLKLCHQMLARERPYAPITLLSELMDLEQTFKDLDSQINQS